MLKKGNKPTEVEHMLIYQIRGPRKKTRSVCCPVSGQKLLTSVMFVGVVKFRRSKHSERNKNISAVH